MKINILIVEDDDNQRGILAGFLKKQGYQIFETGVPESALTIIKENRVDVALSDLRMPGMNGYELLREIKKINPERKIISISGNKENDRIYDYILTKPFNLEKLNLILKEASND